MEPIIKIQDYTYVLPEERIAKYPLPERDASKQLIYENGTITEDVFRNISLHLPENAVMVFNNTKVVPARLLFRRETGALIEIFALEPHVPNDYQLCFAETESCEWKAIVGNMKRWKGDSLRFFTSDETLEKIDLHCDMVENDGRTALVRFTWKGGYAFSEVMDHCGKMPIPPYLKRDTEAIDYSRYQTLYARFRGSVAAPTAGLHFTDRVLKDIDGKGISRETICLHVGAGTFLPVKSDYISDHVMHTEPFEVTDTFLARMANLPEGTPVVAVGTTSVRCLESLFFLGLQMMEKGKLDAVKQWDPYADYDGKYQDHSMQEAFGALYKYLKSNNKKSLISRTGIIIVPGYKWHVCDYLVTNFHQPQSTLLLLVASFTGGDEWKKIYAYALEHGFRFLSYGDSSLLKRSE
ncbi:MAG: S-adenosylmethionine:tRNA ribosyltransferase-isomerase [Bacteroidales bacterium]|jgi:S-adenosylmethionine:tRNA ribosyltransferase-isomerase|nr:S-adenosylmethionine:tRNA ribosyltransferase-isomerase [Bacteroidales bacterium]MCI2122058.1 S-adenosylmethionine:tRNA ribosyltransferase-isomerase [Bacteroidales bacterium]MCI2146201.1 S-adenosylmethionine:tRNA ribosyltransferase-isomerase [Bacteroidales bacterium]